MAEASTQARLLPEIARQAKRVFGYPARRWFRAGVQAFHEGSYGRAQRLLRLRLRVRPGDRMARLYLARVELDLGRERSLATISELLARDPGRPAAVHHALQLQLELGRTQDARQTIEEMGDINRYSDDDFLSIWRLINSEAPELTELLTERLLKRGLQTPGSSCGVGRPTEGLAASAYETRPKPCLYGWGSRQLWRRCLKNASVFCARVLRFGLQIDSQQP